MDGSGTVLEGRLYGPYGLPPSTVPPQCKCDVLYGTCTVCRTALCRAGAALSSRRARAEHVYSRRVFISYTAHFLL